jgi:hypothetical protein
MSGFHSLGLALLLGGAPPPSSAAVVVVDGRRQVVQSAYFGIHLQAEVWDEASRSWKRGIEHGQASYWLNVKVDERSGEDGAAAPDVEDIPVARAAGGKHPSLEALGALTVRELPDGSDCEDWEAWFGNDAPGLCGNVIQFLGWSGPHLRLRWEAHQDGPKGKPFLFEGPSVFAGIYVKVPAHHDPDDYLNRIWGGQPAATLERHLIARTDKGAQRPAEWRHTASYVYMPKGLPLPGYWSPQRGLTPPPPAKP